MTNASQNFIQCPTWHWCQWFVLPGSGIGIEPNSAQFMMLILFTYCFCSVIHTVCLSRYMAFSKQFEKKNYFYFTCNKKVLKHSILCRDVGQQVNQHNGDIYIILKVFAQLHNQWQTTQTDNVCKQTRKINIYPLKQQMNEGGMISKTSFMKTSSMPILH
jgi:hypothetical protein